MNKPHFLRVALLGAALTALTMAGASAAALGAGTVTADALRLRGTPESEGEILATAQSGVNLVVLEDAGDGWYKVNYNTVEGYMSGEWITLLTTADVELGYGKVETEGSSLNLRAAAGTDAASVGTIPSGAYLELKGVDNGWYKVDYAGKSGFVSSDYITIVPEPTEEELEAATLGQQIVDYSMNYLGVRYVLGGNGPDKFDCSGFTSYVYRQFGYSLNRTASTQLNNGTSVSKDQLQPGDLVFFRYNTSKAASHVGIYIGGGQFVHASTNAYKVQVDQLLSGHYANVYVGARRIIE